jgi:hypothetical protein
MSWFGPLAAGVPQGLAGTLSITEADDTVASTGTVLIKGTLSATLAGATLAATGTVALKGTASITEAGDTVSAAGALALKATASIAEADDTISVAGILPIAGTLSATEADDTVSATGSTGGVTATLVAALADAMVSSTGQAAPAPVVVAQRRGGGDREEYERWFREWQDDLRCTIDQAWQIANGEIDPVTLEPISPADLESLAMALGRIRQARDQAALNEFIAEDARLEEEKAIAVLLLAA